MQNKLSICLILILMAGISNAKMADPTEPPKKLLPKVTVETQVLSLKMIRLDDNGKHTANINGEIVELGGVYADAKVVSIDDSSVVLEGPKGEKIVLKLYSTPNKTPARGMAGEETFPDIKKKTK